MNGTGTTVLVINVQCNWLVPSSILKDGRKDPTYLIKSGT